MKVPFSRFFIAALCAAQIVVITVAPARADIVWNGTCTMNLTMRFSPAINLTSGLSTLITISATGSCEQTGDLNNVFRTGTLTASGAGSLDTNCYLVDATGTYSSFSFSPSPPPSSSGTWTWDGNLAGGALAIIGTTSTGGFVAGSGQFVLDPLAGNETQAAACLGTSGGTTRLRYYGELTFVDP